MNLDLKCPGCGNIFVAVVKSVKGVRCPRCRRKVYPRPPYNARVHAGVIVTPTRELVTIARIK